MDLICMTHDERLAMMRKRHAFLSEMVGGYNSFEIFIQDCDERLAIMGIELQDCGTHLYVYMPLGFNEYEGYHIIGNASGCLAVSPAVMWQETVAPTAVSTFSPANALMRKKSTEFSTCIA